MSATPNPSEAPPPVKEEGLQQEQRTPTRLMAGSPYYTVHCAAMDLLTAMGDEEISTADTVLKVKDLATVLKDMLAYQQDPEHRCTNCKAQRAHYLVTYTSSNGEDIGPDDHPQPEKLCHLDCKPNGWQYGSWDWTIQYLNSSCGGGDTLYDANVTILPRNTGR